MENNEKIIVEIAAYRDPELLNTVKSALMQADNPDRITFAICYQSDDLTNYNELKKIKNCKIKYLKEAEAKGSCYARYLCQKMIEDEKYLFQIDSHMRFVKHWDSKLIEELLSLNDSKACISFYPPNCTEEMMSLPLNDKTFDLPGSGAVMYTNGFRENGSLFLACQSYLIDKNEDKRLIKDPFISAGNFFAFAQIHKEVLHDPEMYFYGDELPMAIRYYTNGWNNYCGGKSYVYHNYHRKGQSFPKGDNNMANEQTRFKRLLNIDNENYDMGEFGLGTERTVEDFEKFAGIDFKKRIVYMSAENGEFEKEELKNQMSYIINKNFKEEEFLKQKENIEVIIIDKFGDYAECISAGLNSAVNKENIHFIVGTTKNENIPNTKLEEMHIKELISFKENFTYCKALSELSEKVGECYVAIIDSSVRFLQEWDQKLCEAIKTCGKKSALTSWVWNNQENKEIGPYINVVKELDKFDNYLPVLKYNNALKIADEKHPYQTPFISDGFLFCHSSVLKEIKPDPNLNYEEHKYIYSVRLWTNGIDLYYPKTSYLYKIRGEKYMEEKHHNYGVICSLLEITNSYSKKFKSGYKYELGIARPLWGWYKYIGYNKEDIK